MTQPAPTPGRQPIQAVLFDYGLVLTGPPDPQAWARMGTLMGLNEDQLHSAYWTPRRDYDRGTYSGPDYWRTAARHAGIELSPAQVEALIEADTALWTQVNQPMVDWALRLQAAGTPTGILSNLGDSMMEGVLAKLPWLQGFTHRLWSHTVKLAKPELAIYRHAAEGLGVPPANILFIDDREDNIAGGLAAGMQVVRYFDLPTFERDLEARGLHELWLTGVLPHRTVGSTFPNLHV